MKNIKLILFCLALILQAVPVFAVQPFDFQGNLTRLDGTGTALTGEVMTTSEVQTVGNKTLGSTNSITGEAIKTGLVGVTVGGTGSNTSGASIGSVLYKNTSTTWTSVAPGTSGQVLQTNGVGAAPTWANAGGTSTLTDEVAAAFTYPFANGSVYMRLNYLATIEAARIYVEGGTNVTAVVTNAGAQVFSQSANAGTSWTNAGTITNATILPGNTIRFYNSAITGPVTYETIVLDVKR